jgi:hypothetical protein
MNLFELFVKIGVDDQASSKIGNITQKLGSGLKTAAGIGIAAAGAASAAIVGLTKSAVENYAEYEQLVGGVDTLFKNASQKVQGYAAEAYKTAGMSANDYMENATAFSATLINALGGDTEKAAEYANRAMISMSDNANKMGNNIDSIVLTYQSLSRGNFAMLDNLKLGYGGTQKELERLIKDASTYTDIQEKMGITVDSSSKSFDNIVNAIAVVQGKLGIAGATSAEAATTIEGSVNSMKAAWQNLLTGIADNNADFDVLITNFVDSVGTVAKNILPRVEVALTGVGDLIDTLFPTIIDKIPAIIESVLPKLATSAIDIVNSLVSGISGNQDVIISTALLVVKTLINGILGALPLLATAAMSLVAALATGLSENLDGLIPTVIEVIAEVANTLTNLENVRPITLAAIELILVLIEGVMQALPMLIDTILLVGESITATLLDPEILAKILNAALRIIIALGGGLISSLPRLLTAVFSLIAAVIKNIINADWKGAGENVIDGLLDGLKSAWENIKTWFSNAWDNLFGNRSVDVSANVSGGGVDGSHAGGLDYVPFDGYVAELHKGEQVLTADEADDYRRGGKSVTVIQHIYSTTKSAADLMQEAKYQQERAVLFGV